MPAHTAPRLSRYDSRMHLRALARRAGPIAAGALSLSILTLRALVRHDARTDPLGGVLLAGARRLASASLSDLERDILHRVADPDPEAVPAPVPVAAPQSVSGGVDGDGVAGITASQLGTALGAPTSRVEHYCQRLAERGFLDLEYPSGYRLTPVGRALFASG